MLAITNPIGNVFLFKKRISLGAQTIIATILGITVGWIINTHVANIEIAKSYASQLSIVAEFFLRLIKMVVGPLIFSTLVVGITNLGDAKSVGRIFAKSFFWFIAISFAALLLGLVLANLLEPGKDMALSIPATNDASAFKGNHPYTVKDFLLHMIPNSFAEPFANNEILQIVVLSLFFGMAATAVGEPAKNWIQLIDSLSRIMIKITGYVMKLSPLAVFSSMASVVAQNGLTIIHQFSAFLGDFYLGLALLWLLLGMLGLLLFGKRIVALVGQLREAVLLSFATSSSEASLPLALDGLRRFGVNPRISSFILPLGYSFNLAGGMVYYTFGTLFVAQAYNISIPYSTQIIMLLTLMITSKGIAGIPRVGLIIMQANLSRFHLPEAGILLIMGVDAIADMGRSATNVISNVFVCAAVDRWERRVVGRNSEAYSAEL